MNRDVETPMMGTSEMEAERARPGVTEKRPTDYLSDAMDATTTGAGRVAGYLSQRPLLLGSLIIGVIGAIAGTGIARIQAARRRRTPFERAMDTISTIGMIVTGLITRGPTGAADAMRKRPKTSIDLMGQIGAPLMGGVSMIGRPRAETRGGMRASMSQAGYALSFLPIAITLLRNPMVRDIGLRYLSRRISGR